MHTIAEEHLVNGETDKARAIYYSILTQFADEEYASIRKVRKANTRIGRKRDEKGAQIIGSKSFDELRSLFPIRRPLLDP